MLEMAGLRKEDLRKILDDLSVDKVVYEKGAALPVKNCFHFSTDGKYVDVMFADEEDFRQGMNRVYILSRKYHIVIIAFVLMDTHIHFLLWGEEDECKRFVHEYVRRTSMYISEKYGERNKFRTVPIDKQVVDTDYYLKIVICYIVKNPPVGGIGSMGWDYPWSSGPLYFRKHNSWAAPKWCLSDLPRLGKVTTREYYSLFRTNEYYEDNPRMIDGIVFPGEYVPYELVERIFKTVKSYNYFLSKTKEQDVEAHGGSISRLSIPIQEMAQNKAEVCEQLFGVKTVRSLDTAKRLRLARTLKSKYNCSTKQLARLCGLIYSEVKDLI